MADYGPIPGLWECIHVLTAQWFFCLYVPLIGISVRSLHIARNLISTFALTFPYGNSLSCYSNRNTFLVSSNWLPDISTFALSLFS